MRVCKWTLTSEDRFVYVVESVSDDGYDSYAVSYHLTRKGAYKYIMEAMYQEWECYRYLMPGYHGDYYIREVPLRE